MDNVIQLNIDWKISRIPLFRNESDAADLQSRCERLFRLKGERKMVVVTKRGEILDGFNEVDAVIRLYRSQGALGMVCFVDKPIAVLTKIEPEFKAD